LALLLGYLRIPLPWREILRRTFNEAFFHDNCLGMAAQLAYYFFFALFPALLVIVAIASYFPLTTLVDNVVAILGQVAPPEALAIIADQLRKISQGEQGGLLTLGMLTALWSSSAAMTAIIDTLNRAYDVEEGRPWWKVRLIAIALTVGVALFVLVSVALVLLGPTAATWLAAWWDLGSAFEWTWKILQWPLVFAMASLGIAIVYYFAPDVEQDWVWLTPGSLLATGLWLLATLGFKYYVANMGEYAETYGALAGVMVMMLWFYLSGLVILLGAEMNAEIEHASLAGKEPGEKVAGEKRKLGPRAIRAWAARRRARGEQPPSAEEVKAVVGETPERTPAGADRAEASPPAAPKRREGPGAPHA
jgi:membrane protein